MVLQSLAPEIIVGLGALIVLLADTFTTKNYNKVITGISLVSVLLALVSSVLLFDVGEEQLFSGTLVVDSFSLFFKIAIFSVSALIILFSLEYIEEFYPDGSDNVTEYMSLVLFAALGMSLMSGARSLVTAFIALELASLPSYSLVGFMKNKKASIEGSMKYFLLGALSSAILLYGISLVYGASGTFDLVEIKNAGITPLMVLGSLLILFGFSFKVAAVPFQVWAPDAYTGAPTTITAFISSASKIAGFVLLFRIFSVAFPAGEWLLAAQIIAVITMTFGNFVAAVQTSVKRMLAYSSIGHAGYVFIALAVLTNPGSVDSSIALGAAGAHLFVYGIMNTGAFLIVALVDDYWGIGYNLKDYAGLAKKAPVIGLSMGVFLLSLAGLPVGGGFLSKLVLFGSAVNSGFWWLALIAVINSALSLYYYARVLRFMWVEEPKEELSIGRKPLSLYIPIAVAAIVTVILLFAFDPVLSTSIDAASALL